MNNLKHLNTAEKHNNGNLLKKIGIFLFWLILWQILSSSINNSIIFVGPADVLASLAAQITTPEFWKTIGLSSFRIFIGFLSAFFCGIMTGCLAFRFSFLDELLAPVMLLAKSIPVASFVILALIWTGSENLSVFIAFTIVLPMSYTATLSGLKSTDEKLLEMAFVFRFSFPRKVKAVYFPALLPYLMTSVRTALGMSFKSGVAAEVIGVPSHSIGEQLYMAKIYLDTAGLFSWTLVIIAVTFLIENLFLFFLEVIMELILDNIYKSYGSLPVLSGVSMKIASPDICCLMAPSGTGKTTLFRLIMGLEKPDSGTICPAPEQIRFSAVFQEDRLIPEFSPLENVALALPGRPDRPSLFRELARLLPEEAIIRPVSTLSGGMKRRCALLRALLAPCDMFIFDEPFTGLDEKTKDRVIRYLLEKTDGRPVLMSTHDRNDAGALGAKILEFN